MIIGITGTNGAGKGTVVEYLVKTRGFTHCSGREFISKEIRRRGLLVNRDTLREVGNDLRKIKEPGYIAKELFRCAREGRGDAIIESLRNVGEAAFLKSEGVLVWAVDANRKKRYDRVVLRGSETDQVTYERFVEQEEREMNATEAHDMNIFGVMALADTVLTNNGTRQELELQVEAALKKAQK